MQPYYQSIKCIRNMWNSRHKKKKKTIFDDRKQNGRDKAHISLLVVPHIEIRCDEARSARITCIHQINSPSGIEKLFWSALVYFLSPLGMSIILFGSISHSTWSNNCLPPSSLQIELWRAHHVIAIFAYESCSTLQYCKTLLQNANDMLNMTAKWCVAQIK